MQYWSYSAQIASHAASPSSRTRVVNGSSSRAQSWPGGMRSCSATSKPSTVGSSASSRWRIRWPPKKRYASGLSIVNGCVARP